MLRPHHRDSHIQRSRYGGCAPKEGYGVSRVAIDDPGVAMDVLVGWS